MPTTQAAVAIMLSQRTSPRCVAASHAAPAAKARSTRARTSPLGSPNRAAAATATIAGTVRIAAVAARRCPIGIATT
jgi:hypothetical protein